MSYQNISKSNRDKHVAEMVELASTAGLQRSRAQAVLTDLADKYAFSVSYGRGSARIAGNGDESVADRKDEDAANPADDDQAGMLAGLSTKLSDIVVPGSAPCNKKVGSVLIPCGICVIVAGGGVGKTPLAHHLASSGVENYGVVRVGEPFAGYTTNRRTIARDLGKAMALHSDVVLDSIKDLLAEGGNAMKGGVSRAALLDLSAWAITAAALGTTIYIPLNPSGDAHLIEIMVEVARSNATMTMSHVAGSDWEYSTRTLR